jgi:hypothetical protein
MSEIIALEGPVESSNGRLILRIPLAVGGDQLALCAEGIGKIDGDELEVNIPESLAIEAGITEGVVVQVDNRGNKFNITVVGSNGSV